MKTRQRAPKTAEDIHALVKNAERLRERRSIRLAQASLAAAVGFMLMTASHVVDTPTVLWVALVALAACVALMVTAWDTHAEVRDLEETLRGFTPQELLYGPSPERLARSHVAVQVEPSPEVASKIAALTTEGIDLWWKHRLRNLQGVLLGSLGLIVCATAFFAGSSTLAWTALILALTSGGLLILGLRTQHKIDNIDRQLLQLDAPLIAEWPEELQKKVIAVLDELEKRIGDVDEEA